jgi:hypothetical protein
MAIRPITDTMRHMRSGQFIDDASTKLAEIVNAVDITGKPGKLTIEITVKKVGRAGALELVDKVSAKVPHEAPITTLMFPTPEGNLMTSDPRQQALELQVVPIPTGDSITAIHKTA